MIIQPENNIKLEDGQIQAIEETKTRLLNIESEISIANKNLKGLKSESERLVKDNIYQSELLIATEAKLKPLQAEVADLESKITTKTQELSKITAEIETKSKELDDREAKVIEDEKEIAIREQSLLKKEFATDEARLEIKNKVTEFNTKVAKLKEVLPTL